MNLHSLDKDLNVCPSNEINLRDAGFVHFARLFSLRTWNVNVVHASSEEKRVHKSQFLHISLSL